MDFRPDFQPAEIDFLRARARNAMVLLDVVNCRAGYSPTHFQRGLFPAELRPKIAGIFDGIETDVFNRRTAVPARVGERTIDRSTRIVTYVSQGLESMRGFDILRNCQDSIDDALSNGPADSPGNANRDVASSRTKLSKNGRDAPTDADQPKTVVASLYRIRL